MIIISTEIAFVLLVLMALSLSFSIYTYTKLKIVVKGHNDLHSDNLKLLELEKLNTKSIRNIKGILDDLLKHLREEQRKNETSNTKHPS